MFDTPEAKVEILPGRADSISEAGQPDSEPNVSGAPRFVQSLDLEHCAPAPPDEILELAEDPSFVPFPASFGRILGFYKHKEGEHLREFSNFYPGVFICRMLYGREEFPQHSAVKWSEQAIMALKAELFNDYATFVEIMEASDQYAVKAAGQRVRNFDQETWNTEMRKIAFNVLYHKFYHGQMRYTLLQTSRHYIAEMTSNDHIWGTGLDIGHPDGESIEKWPGQNILGHTLTCVRIFVEYCDQSDEPGHDDGDDPGEGDEDDAGEGDDNGGDEGRGIGPIDDGEDTSSSSQPVQSSLQRTDTMFVNGFNPTPTIPPAIADIARICDENDGVYPTLNGCWALKSHCTRACAKPGFQVQHTSRDKAAWLHGEIVDGSVLVGMYVGATSACSLSSYWKSFLSPTADALFVLSYWLS